MTTNPRRTNASALSSFEVLLTHQATGKAGIASGSGRILTAEDYGLSEDWILVALDTLPWYSKSMPGYSMNKDDLLGRLRRVEGQVRGLHQMIEEDRYCIDVLTQISAATKALQSVAVGMFDDHLRHCVADAVAPGGRDADEKLTEATAAVARLLKS